MGDNNASAVLWRDINVSGLPARTRPLLLACRQKSMHNTELQSQ